MPVPTQMVCPCLLLIFQGSAISAMWSALKTEYLERHLESQHNHSYRQGFSKLPKDCAEVNEILSVQALSSSSVLSR